MKKGILFLIITAFSLTSFSQKWAYVSYFTEGNLGTNTVTYFSAAIDLTKLDCSNTPTTKNGYKSDRVTFYTDCAAKWFFEKTKRIGYDLGTFNNYHGILRWKNENGYNPNCSTKNEDACFFKTKEEAEQARQKYIQEYRRNNADTKIVEIE